MECGYDEAQIPCIVLVFVVVVYAGQCNPYVSSKYDSLSLKRFMDKQEQLVSVSPLTD